MVRVMTYKLDTRDAVIMEIPAIYSPLTVTTVLAPNLSLSGIAEKPFRKENDISYSFIIIFSR